MFDQTSDQIIAVITKKRRKKTDLLNAISFFKTVFIACELRVDHDFSMIGGGMKILKTKMLPEPYRARNCN